MTGSSQSTLRSLFLAGYDDLKHRLTRRLGSADHASDALQETFLRLDRAAVVAPVQNPQAYLFRAAMNVAINQRTAETRRLSSLEIEDLLNIPDQNPNPAQAAESRSEIDALKRALAELPVRRREICVAVWVDGEAHQALAQRYGVTVRTIQMELKAALEFCARRLGRKVIKNFASATRQLS
jgi:RNA polymerase sigma factor (sigma-70 family)